MTYSIYDNSFVNSNLYTSFKQDNPGFGYYVLGKEMKKVDLLRNQR